MILVIERRLSFSSIGGRSINRFDSLDRLSPESEKGKKTFFSYGVEMIMNTFRVIMKSKLLFITVILIFVLPQRVSAYLDPGFGSMVWQMIAAVAFGATFAVKIYWQKIKNFFSGPKKNKPQE